MVQHHCLAVPLSLAQPKRVNPSISALLSRFLRIALRSARLKEDAPHLQNRFAAIPISDGGSRAVGLEPAVTRVFKGQGDDVPTGSAHDRQHALARQVEPAIGIGANGGFEHEEFRAFGLREPARINRAASHRHTGQGLVGVGRKDLAGHAW